MAADAVQPDPLRLPGLGRLVDRRPGQADARLLLDLRQLEHRPPVLRDDRRGGHLRCPPGPVPGRPHWLHPAGFWGPATPPGENRTHYHMPLPGDLSSASASLLLAQPPQLTDDDSSVDEKPEGGRIRRRAVAMKPVTHRGTGQRHLRISVLTLSLQHRRHRRSRRCMQLAQGRREPGYRVLNWISHLRRPRPAFRPGRTPESNCTPVTCTRTFRQSGPHRRKPAGPVGSPPRATRTTGWRKAGGDR